MIIKADYCPITTRLYSKGKKTGKLRNCISLSDKSATLNNFDYIPVFKLTLINRSLYLTYGVGQEALSICNFVEHSFKQSVLVPKEKFKSVLHYIDSHFIIVLGGTVYKYCVSFKTLQELIKDYSFIKIVTKEFCDATLLGKLAKIDGKYAFLDRHNCYDQLLTAKKVRILEKQLSVEGIYLDVLEDDTVLILPNMHTVNLSDIKDLEKDITVRDYTLTLDTKNNILSYINEQNKSKVRGYKAGLDKITDGYRDYIPESSYNAIMEYLKNEAKQSNIFLDV